MLLVRSLREDDLALWTRRADVMKCQGDVIIQIRGERKRKAERKKGMGRQRKEEKEETSRFRALPIRNDEKS